MLSDEAKKKILESVKAKQSKPAETEKDYKGDARKAAAKRLFAAIETKSEEDFLSALGDLSTISEDSD